MKVKERKFDYDDEVIGVNDFTASCYNEKGYIKTFLKDDGNNYLGLEMDNVVNPGGDDYVSGTNEEGTERWYCDYGHGIFLDEGSIIKTSELLDDGNRKIIIQKIKAGDSDCLNDKPEALKKVSFYFRKYWLRKDGFKQKDREMINFLFKRGELRVHKTYIIDSKDLFKDKIITANLILSFNHSDAFPSKTIFIKTEIKSKIKIKQVFILGEI